MYSSLATGIFAIRSGNKAIEGDPGRVPITFVQGASVLKAAARYNNKFSNTIRSAFDVCDEIAKTDKLFSGLTKVVKFASEHVNPLIAAVSGIKVICADDKKTALLTEGGCVAGMMIGEGIMKKHLEGILSGLKISGKWSALLKGLIFVTGSISSSTLGHKIGGYIAEQFITPEELAKAQLKSKSLPKSFSYKA